MKLGALLAAALIAANSLPSATAAAALQSEDSERISIEEAPDDLFSGSRSREMLKVQVLLNRARFSPGVIDGIGGENTRKAIEAYQRAEGMEADGEVSDRLVSRLEEGGGEVLRRYTITDEDVEGPFADSIPDGLEAQAELDRLSYTGPEEALAEEFHMDQDFLKALNPDADFDEAGTEIIVAARRGDGIDAKVVRIEVDKDINAVRAYGEDDKLLAFYPATVGSESLPSPDGEMAVKAVAQDASYHFDPEVMSWGPDKRLEIAPGPNNPVGTTWIDLSEDSYGIHGSPDPALISKTASHGCVRLTNWDVEELAEAVSEGVRVEFVGG